MGVCVMCVRKRIHITHAWMRACMRRYVTAFFYTENIALGDLQFINYLCVDKRKTDAEKR